MKPIESLSPKAALPYDLVVPGDRSSRFKNHVSHASSLRLDRKADP